MIHPRRNVMNFVENSEEFDAYHTFSVEADNFQISPRLCNLISEMGGSYTPQSELEARYLHAVDPLSLTFESSPYITMWHLKISLNSFNAYERAGFVDIEVDGLLTLIHPDFGVAVRPGQTLFDWMHFHSITMSDLTNLTSPSFVSNEYIENEVNFYESSDTDEELPPYSDDELPTYSDSESVNYPRAQGLSDIERDITYCEFLDIPWNTITTVEDDSEFEYYEKEYPDLFLPYGTETEYPEEPTPNGGQRIPAHVKSFIYLLNTFAYFIFAYLLPGAEATSHGLIQFSDVETYWVSSISSKVTYVKEHPFVFLILFIAVLVFVLTNKYFTDRYRNRTLVNNDENRSYRSLIDLLISDDQRPEVQSPKNVFLGFIFETSIYLFLNILDPTLCFIHPLLIQLLPGKTKVKFVIPTPLCIILCQCYYLACSGVNGYQTKLAFVGERTSTLFLLVDELRFWATKRQKVSQWLSKASKHGLNHFLYLSSLYGLIYDIQMNTQKVLCIVGNMTAYFSLSAGEDLLTLMKTPFAQANYEESLMDSAFSFLGPKFSTLKKISDMDTVLTKFHNRFCIIKTYVRKFVITHYLKRNPTEYDFEYLYPGINANLENLSVLYDCEAPFIAGYAKVYKRVDEELRTYWRLRKKMINYNFEKDFPKHYNTWKEIASKLEQRFKETAPAFTEVRQEALCVFACGLSDTGKTTNLSPAINRMLFRHEEVPFSYYNNVYFPCKSSQYWTGYSPYSSLAVVFDDPAPLKMAEVQQDPTTNPYAIFMDLANTCNVTLDQAAIQDKGMKFTSKVAFISNNAECETKAFATPSAILNRIAQFEVIPKTDFVTLIDVPCLPKPQGVKIFENNSYVDRKDQQYYYTEMAHLLSLSEKRQLIVNKQKMIEHVHWAEINFTDEFERSVNIMDYCVFRIKKGRLPAYFKVAGQQLSEGDIIDSRTLMTLLDEEYKRLAATYEVESAKCDATSTPKTVEEVLGSMKEYNESTVSWYSSLDDFIDYASKEIAIFTEKYRTDTLQLIQIATFMAAVIMLLIAIHQFIFKNKNYEESQCIEEMCLDLGIPMAQNDTYQKDSKAKSAVYKVKKAQVRKNGARWHPKPVGQGAITSKPVPVVHTTFKEEISTFPALTEEEYDSFFEYPCEEEECDIMLQYANKQSNQEFRKKYFSKGAVLIYTPGGQAAICKGIGIKDNLMAVPHHMIPYLSRGFDIETLLHGRCVIDKNQWREVGHKDDKAILELTKLPFQFPNFMNNFVSDKELVDIVSCQPQLLLPGTINNHMVMMVASMASASYKVQEFNYLRPGTNPSDMENSESWIKLPRYLYYSCTNAAGFCGSPLVGTYGCFAGKILGMHIAGDYKMSYATLMTKEDIEYILVQKAQGLADYRTEPCKPFPQCRESSMKISKFYDDVKREFGVKKFPPICKIYYDDEGNLVEPCQSKLDAFHELKSGLIDPTIDRIVREELSYENDSINRVLTDEETIFGFGRLNSMDMSTAIGYYLMVNDTRTKIAGEGKRKQYFMHKNYDGRIIKPSGWPMVLNIVQQRVELLKTQVLQTEYIASPKTNEALKPGKGVRLFYVGDVITLFMVRKYFGDLLSHTMENNVDNEMAIGVNPYSFDWKRIINRLSEFEVANYNDGDVSGMEYNMYFPEVKESIIAATMAFYRGCDETDNAVRENLIRSLFNCRVIWEGYFHDGMTFNPSGHPLTTFFNCMVIRYWKRYTYYTVQLESIGSLITFPYGKWNRLIVMGDDSVEATHIDVYDWYKPEKAAEVALRFGITITTALKDTDFKPKSRLDQCDFLKRKFDVTKNGVPLPRLEKTSIETSLLYVKGKHSTEARNSCVDAALCEAYYHGKEYFFRVRDTIRRTRQRKRLSDLILNDYNYYAQRQAEAYCDIEADIDYGGTYAEFFE